MTHAMRLLAQVVSAGAGHSGEASDRHLCERLVGAGEERQGRNWRVSRRKKVDQSGV